MKYVLKVFKIVDGKKVLYTTWEDASGKSLYESLGKDRDKYLVERHLVE